MLQRQQVIKQFEFIEEDVEKPLTCDFVSCIDRLLQPEYITVFEVCITEWAVGIDT